MNNRILLWNLAAVVTYSLAVHLQCRLTIKDEPSLGIMIWSLILLGVHVAVLLALFVVALIRMRKPDALAYALSTLAVGTVGSGLCWGSAILAG